MSLTYAIDTGAIKPDNNDGYARGHLTGTSLAMTAVTPSVQSSLSVGFPLDSPSWLSVDDYSLNYSINFAL